MAHEHREHPRSERLDGRDGASRAVDPGGARPAGSPQHRRADRRRGRAPGGHPVGARHRARGRAQREILRAPGRGSHDPGRHHRSAPRRPALGRPHDDRAADPPSASRRQGPADRDGLDRRHREGAARSLSGRGRHAADAAPRRRERARALTAAIGTPERPLRVAIIGAGPTGFYTTDHLLRSARVVEVDLFDRLPTPYGLVRLGVAPDHQKIKFVTNVFDKVAANPGFRFYGGVEFGKDVTRADLKAHYHQIVYCTGAQTALRMGIPGEDLTGTHPATEFVAWYNGHPDYRDCAFDLSQESVAVVGVGNVAADVVRSLCRTPEELATTDIADYALEALRKSRVREVYLLGRRGPAQAAFTNPEVKELGELADADVTARPEEVELDPLSRAAVERSQDRATQKKVEILKGYARRHPTGKSRKLIIRFLVSPVELCGNEAGEVMALRLVRNRLEATAAGTLQAKPTDQFETLPVGLVFRSVGYRGVPLPGVTFHESWGVILNEQGRVLDPDTKQPVPGEYAAGWIKRGPTGVIGTNKPDAAETVQCMFEDLAQGAVLQPRHPDAASAEALVRQRRPHYVSYTDWLRLDQLEVARGRAQGRPRVKFIQVEEMLAALRR